MNSSDPYRIPGLELVEHTLSVPLDYGEPDGRKITVFAREVRSLKPESADMPFLVFLQGGPGFRGPLPISKSGWLKRALTEFRVLILDQRGNGLSSKVQPPNLCPQQRVARPDSGRVLRRWV